MSSPLRVSIFATLTLACAVGCSTDAVSPAALGSVVLASGDGQSGTPGLPVPDTLRAQVLSVTGQPMAGVAVTWTVTYGGATLSTPGQKPDSGDIHTITYGIGTLTTITDTSDANGYVRALLRLGPAPGTARIVAAAAGLPGVTFTATARGLQATHLAVGLVTSCAIDIQSRTWCWGSTVASGDSGVASAPFYTPRLVAGGHHFVELAAGEEHVCGLDAAGAVWCWGDDTYQQLGSGGTGSTNYPVQLLNAPSFAHIFGGDALGGCGLTSDGTAYCWGNNGSGELGTGSNAATVADPQPVAGGIKFTSLSPTFDHACGIAVGGAAYCWGNDHSYLLGDNGVSGLTSNVPVPVSGGHTFLTLSATDAYACGVTRDAGEVCWGLVPDGGDPRGAPTPAPQLASFNEYQPASDVSFGIRGHDAISLQTFTTPVNEGAPDPLHGLTAGYWTTCALAQDGTVYCWGQNDQGQAGNPDSYPYDGGHSSAHAVVVPSNY